MPWRSVEDVALHRRPFPRFALLIEETDESGAAARERHVMRNEFRPAATYPRRPEKPDAFSFV